MEKEYKRCLRCGRILKNPEYKKIGYGKICYEKLNKKPTAKLLFTMDKK